jgi:hypothetical protein
MCVPASDITEQFEGHSFNRYDDGTQEVPKHVGDCAPISFTFQCM